MTQTADLILEILNEEIPSRMQLNAAESFKNSFAKKLTDYVLVFEDAHCLISPRRISLHIKGIPILQEDREEEKRGPRVGAPEQAIQGFLTSAGLASLDQCEQRATEKGDFWFATKFIKGLNTKEVLPTIIQDVIAGFTWPKSMHWAKNTLAWVRPIRSILCMFNNEAVPGHLDLGSDLIPFCDTTVGHRFLSPTVLSPDNYLHYRELLLENYVLLDQQERKAKIAKDIESLAQKHGLSVRQDEDLLNEVTGLVEWPVAMIGKIDPAFMDLPEEVLITSMRVHQRYFALEENGKLAPYFILISNIEPTDGGKALIIGNERVLRARLSDAKFFFEQDKLKSLEEYGKGLTQAIFQEDLGTMADKVTRMVHISEYLADTLKLDSTQAKRAATLSKCDLMSQMVGEFPELQGIMGDYYSRHQQEDSIIAEAIADHYKPKGFADDMPRSAIGRIISLADKIDTLVGYFAIGIKPTGSKDPYALRRSSIGCIRLLETMGNLQIDDLIAEVYKTYASVFSKTDKPVTPLSDLIIELREFFFDRLKAYWKEKGLRHDYLDAVFSIAGKDSFDVIALRVEALNAFLERSDGNGEKLLAAYRRASNIVRIEEKKDNVIFEPQVKSDLLEDESEKCLHQILQESTNSIKVDMGQHDFEKVMKVLADLRPHIDDFFDKVTVNSENKNLRENRLRLLSLIRHTLHQVADFSKIEG